MKLTFKKKELDTIQLPDFPNMNKPSGQEHYKLLNYFANRFHEGAVIFDVGTHKGYSALALAYHTGAIVISYDVTDEYHDPAAISIARPDHDADFIVGNVLDDANLLESDLILLDTDHEGSFENEFYCHIRRDFKGFLILDDINVNDQMINFWNSIEERKIDLTPVGHYTGTGLIIFE